MSDIGAEHRSGDDETIADISLISSEDSDNDDVSVPIAANVSNS